MAQQIQLRNGTAAAWTTANSILALGELGLETDTKKSKMGDGATAWTSLVYTAASGTTRAYRGAVASQAAMLALTTVNVGDWVTRTDLSQVFELTIAGQATLGNWASYPAGGGSTLVTSYLTTAVGYTLTSANVTTATSEKIIQTTGNAVMNFLIPLDTVLGITGFTVIKKLQTGTGLTAFVADTANGVILDNDNNIVSTSNSLTAIQWKSANRWVLLG